MFENKSVFLLEFCTNSAEWKYIFFDVTTCLHNRTTMLYKTVDRVRWENCYKIEKLPVAKTQNGFKSRVAKMV